MPKQTSLEKVRKEIALQKRRIAELEEKYRVQLYFETMPEYDPVYKYCYQTSNMHVNIPGYEQCIDYWLQAIIKHMGLRWTGHGGEYTKAVLISVPDCKNQQEKDEWLNYAIKKLSKKVRIKNS